MTSFLPRPEPLTHDFLQELKRTTEARWSSQSIDPELYGFQFQQGTRWNAGLTDQKIEEYENSLRHRFPRDFKVFLGAMNGTDLPTLNVYGDSGFPAQQSIGVYSYPRDIDVIRQRIAEVGENRDELSTTLAEQGFNLPGDAGLVPIYGHRYVMCSSDPDSSVVLSIADPTDAVVYGSSLREYLENEFLDRG